MGDREFGGVDALVDVLPPIGPQRPVKFGSAAISEEVSQGAAQIAATTGPDDGPIVGRPGRNGEQALQPAYGVVRQRRRNVHAEATQQQKLQIEYAIAARRESADKLLDQRGIGSPEERR